MNNGTPIAACLSHAARYFGGAWLAAQLYFLFATTLPIFRHFGVDRAKAGEIVQVLFPHYYAANYLCGVVFIIAMVLASGALKRARICIALAIVALICIFAVQFGIAPRLQELRAAGDTAGFGKLHGISMSVNLIAMVCVLLAGALFTTRKNAN
jgi:hypothetical protein